MSFQGCEQVQGAGRRKKKPFLFLENDSEKILERSQSAVKLARLNQTQNWS